MSRQKSTMASLAAVYLEPSPPSHARAPLSTMSRPRVTRPVFASMGLRLHGHFSLCEVADSRSGSPEPANRRVEQPCAMNRPVSRPPPLRPACTSACFLSPRPRCARVRLHLRYSPNGLVPCTASNRRRLTFRSKSAAPGHRSSTSTDAGFIDLLSSCQRVTSLHTHCGASSHELVSIAIPPCLCFQAESPGPRSCCFRELLRYELPAPLGFWPTMLLLRFTPTSQAGSSSKLMVVCLNRCTTSSNRPSSMALELPWGVTSTTVTRPAQLLP